MEVPSKNLTRGLPWPGDKDSRWVCGKAVVMARTSWQVLALMLPKPKETCTLTHKSNRRNHDLSTRLMQHKWMHNTNSVTGLNFLSRVPAWSAVYRSQHHIEHLWYQENHGEGSVESLYFGGNLDVGKTDIKRWKQEWQKYTLFMNKNESPKYGLK